LGRIKGYLIFNTREGRGEQRRTDSRKRRRGWTTQDERMKG